MVPDQGPLPTYLFEAQLDGPVSLEGLPGVHDAVVNGSGLFGPSLQCAPCRGYLAAAATGTLALHRRQEGATGGP